MAEGTNLKFCQRIDQKNEKLVKRGRDLGHVTYFLNFGTPLISLELLKIQVYLKFCMLLEG